jgi:hypothetical protein
MDRGMKRIPSYVLVMGLMVALSGFLYSQSAEKAGPCDRVVKEKLVGAWRLAWVDEPQADGKVTRYTNRRGTIAYTRDGHMSVQIMLPEGEAPSGKNPVKYDQGSYEAYFGTYDVDEQAHTVTHHVEGALVRALVGKNLTRVYHFSDGQLILKSLRPDEHWAIAWEHY